MTPAKLKKAMEAHSKMLAKKRDELRDLLSDVEQMADDCTEAVEYLNLAIDKLSEMQ